jgi:cytoskeletal protein RodZ
MESLGKYLKTEREARELSLEEVSRATRIRVHILRAIEEDRYEQLPTWAYLRGFLTGYTKHLGLKPEAVLLRYQENLSPIIPKYKPLKPQTRIISPGKRVRPSSFFAVALAFILFVLVFMYYDSYEPSAGFSNSILPVQEGITTEADRQKPSGQAVPILLASPNPVKTEAEPDITASSSSPFEVTGQP